MYGSRNSRKKAWKQGQSGRKNSANQAAGTRETSAQTGTEEQDRKLTPVLRANLNTLLSEMGGSEDLIIREYNAPVLGQTLAFAYIDGLVDTATLSEFTIQSVFDEMAGLKEREQEARAILEQQEVWGYEDEPNHESDAPGTSESRERKEIWSGAGYESVDNREAELRSNAEKFLQLFKHKVLAIGQITQVSCWSDLYLHLLSGDTLILIDGIDSAVAASTKGGERRSVSEPESQTVIRGPREGFTESIRTNTALLRRKIKSPNLWLEETQLGRVTQTDVGIMYLHGTADEKHVQEIRKRLSAIDIDGILESGYIEELIENTNATIFPTVYHSERPDVIAASLLEGRIAILVDGTPFVLLLPTTFNMFFQASEDYYSRFDVGSLIRVLRFSSFVIGLLLPSFYVAIIGYHQEMIPTSWLLKLAVQREGVPFPAFVEAFIMEGVFEVLREAGVRMPRTVGNTISIVGGLVLGQAAVEAGIVSPVVVIVVSLTAISSFVSPAYNIGIAARMLRFGMLIAASMFGIYGIACMLLMLVLHLCSLKSLNVPYMAPYSPIILSDLKDTLIRLPQDYMKKRPKLISRNNPVRFREGPLGNQQADRDQNEPHRTETPDDQSK